MKRILLVLAIGVGPWLSTSAAQESQPPPAPVIVAQFLGFSDAQAARFQQLLQSLQATVGGLEQQVKTRYEALERLLSQDRVDPASVGALLLELRALEKQAGLAFQAYHESFLALLTPEQKQKAAAVGQAAQLLPAVRAFAEVRLIEPPH